MYRRATVGQSPQEPSDFRALPGALCHRAGFDSNEGNLRDQADDDWPVISVVTVTGDLREGGLEGDQVCPCAGAVEQRVPTGALASRVSPLGKMIREPPPPELTPSTDDPSAQAQRA